MNTRILTFFFAMIFALGMAQAALAITVTVTAIPNDDIDDSAAVQQAFNKAIVGGGGTVVFPPGIWDIKNGVGACPAGSNPVNLTIKGDGGSVVRISVGSEQNALSFGNLNQLQFENLIFVGKNVPIGHPEFIDAGNVIVAHYVSSVNFSHTSFFGLAVPSPGAIIYTTSNFTADNCLFEGLNAAYPDGAVVSLDCCTSQMQNSRISSSIFLDYAHFNGQYLSKTPALTGSWVRARQTLSPASMSTQNLTIVDTFFDEGAVTTIDVQNLFALNLRGLKVNLNGISIGTGVKADNINRLRIEDSIFGYASSYRPLAILVNSNAEMIGVTRRENAQCPEVDELSVVSYRLSDCK
jgi:hypothetical protein